ncbi:MAG TPA: hypothetical protein VD905_07515, partial [Flavobacteriales bacterium]|nr:hypothetical protein [Flavobacteriales bacterium]
GLVPLQVCLFSIILPAFATVIIAGIKIPVIGKVILKGWLAGIVAVALYDLSRVPFIINGWSDFIPKIGAWLTNTHEPDAVLGYLWRYAGNGGGMGVAFFVLMFQFRRSERIILIGLLYGLFIFASLMCILVLFREAQEMMFKLTPFTFAGSLIGHVIYGVVLAMIWKRIKRQDNTIRKF